MGNQVDRDTALECLEVARAGGMNFFDTAEQYADGAAERVLGELLADLGWPRRSFVLSTKFYWGRDGDGVNMRDTLNRKYLMQAIDGSLERLGTDFVDVVFCHRPDPGTPLEETVWAMSDIVASGRALYWGTSQWSARAIREAWAIADRHHLRKPVVEQPEYHLLERERVEVELAPVCEDLGLGLTTWSPLASGILTGKYAREVPSRSRGAQPGFEFLSADARNGTTQRQVAILARAAERLGCTPAQLALAWCLANPNVSSVITGATSASQVRENLGALDVATMIDTELYAAL